MTPSNDSKEQNRTNLEAFSDRKLDHLKLALSPEFQAADWTGFDRVELQHRAVGALDFYTVNIEQSLLTDAPNQMLKTPYFVTGMTAGVARAAELNELLASACEERGWGLGLGSLRKDLTDLGAPDDSTNVGVDDWAGFRERHPDLSVFANIGAAQLGEVRKSKMRTLFGRLKPQLIFVHFNILQEALQPEGTPVFSRCLDRLKEFVEVCSGFGIRVAVKETGCGFSKNDLRDLMRLELAAVDVSGLGGTHWGRIEGARSQPNSMLNNVSKAFANWGISTVQSVLNALEVRSEAQEKTFDLWASGGVRTGVDAVKLLALGASRVGFGKPVLEASAQGKEALTQWMQERELELKIALFCLGTSDIKSLAAGKDFFELKK